MYKLKMLYQKFPIIGFRTFKTVIAVIISSLFMQYVLKQNPFFACIGAVVAMEKTMSMSIRIAVIRNVGTITGGLIGIAITSFTESLFVMAVGLVVLIWVNNIAGKSESIVPGAIVYFAVFYLNTMDSALIYGLTRIMGTLIGTLIALAVNTLIFPPKPQDEILDADLKNEVILK